MQLLRALAAAAALAMTATASTADELAKRGMARADSKVVHARSLVGMVVREGAAKPDITSVGAFRNALLAAKSIAYSDSGSGTYLSTKLFAQIGVADRTRKSAQPQAMTDTTTPRLMHYVI